MVFCGVLFLSRVRPCPGVCSNRIIGRRRGYATITGKGLTVRRTALGKARWPILAAVGLFFFVFVVLPFGLLAWQTLMRVEGDYGLRNLTLHYWLGRGTSTTLPGLLRSSALGHVLMNTLKIALFSGMISAFLGLLAGYGIVRLRGSWVARLLEQVSFLPYLIPSIAFGAIYLAMFARPIGPLPSLYGTLALLILVSAVKYLPMAARSGTSAMIQVGQDLEEAAVVQGAGWWRRFLRILLPLTKDGAIIGFLFTFISAMKELSLEIGRAHV